MEFLRYRSTEQECKQGLSSSVSSGGLVGVVNRFIANLCRQEEVDILGAVSDLWKRKLIGPPDEN